MRNEQLDALFPRTPEGFGRAMRSAVDALDERVPSSRRPMKWVPVSAILAVLLLGTLACAAGMQWRLVDFLKDYAPTEGAGKIIQTQLSAHSVQVGDVKFELAEAAYDGEQIFLTLKMSADQPLVEGGPLYGSVCGAVMDGPDGAAFYLSSEQYEDGAMYTMVTIPHASTGTDVACVGLILYSYNSNKDSWSRGKLIYDVPLSKDALNVRTMNTPVSMNGVTVTQVKLSYSPLKTYIMVRYHIDPELGRFERMRREGMSFELMRDGEPIRDYRLWITPTEAEEAEASGDFILRSDLKTTEPYDHLTITLTGRDREVYWKHTVQFKEADE